ncbi:MAG: hypothetical protein R2856_35260 [Caldilineaceae bacterium]
MAPGGQRRLFALRAAHPGRGRSHRQQSRLQRLTALPERRHLETAAGAPNLLVQVLNETH